MCKHQELGRKLAGDYQGFRDLHDCAVRVGHDRSAAWWVMRASEVMSDLERNLELHKVSCETEEN